VFRVFFSKGGPFFWSFVHFPSYLNLTMGLWCSPPPAFLRRLLACYKPSAFPPFSDRRFSYAFFCARSAVPPVRYRNVSFFSFDGSVMAPVPSRWIVFPLPFPQEIFCRTPHVSPPQGLAKRLRPVPPISVMKLFPHLVA